MPNRIYAYTVVGKDAEPWERISGQTRTVGTGLIKVGQTTKRSARERIKQQLGTAYPNLEGVEILLDEPAAREGRHRVLRPRGPCRARRQRNQASRR